MSRGSRKAFEKRLTNSPTLNFFYNKNSYNTLVLALCATPGCSQWVRLQTYKLFLLPKNYFSLKFFMKKINDVPPSLILLNKTSMDVDLFIVRSCLYLAYQVNALVTNRPKEDMCNSYNVFWASELLNIINKCKIYDYLMAGVKIKLLQTSVLLK